MERWEADLRDQLNGVSSRVKTRPHVVSRPMDGAGILVAITISIVMIVAALLWTSGQAETEVPEEPVTPPAVTTEDRVVNLERRVAVCELYCRILGTALNNNVHVMRYEKDKADLVHVNRDWTFAVYPKHLRVTEEDRQFLERYTRVNP